MPCLPSRFAALILCFAPLFLQRSWRHAEVLLVGAILAPGRRTVASLLRITGRARERRFVNYHRVLNRAAWSGLAAARVLLGLLLDAFAPDGPVLLGGAGQGSGRVAAGIPAEGWTTRSSGGGASASAPKGSIVIRCAPRARISSRRAG
jgi:hypothetical protein